MIPPTPSPEAEVRVSPRRIAGSLAVGLAVIGALLLASPVHLPGALIFVAGIALFCYARPVAGLWLVLIGSAIHPLLAKVVQVDLGATGSAVVVFSAWKEIGLGAVVLADLERIVRDYLPERRLQLKPGPTDAVAVALVALVLIGLALRHDLMAVNGARLLLFPIGIYFALRFAPLETARYFKVMVAVAAGVAVFAVIQSSLLGWSFITTYWGVAGDPLPVTFMAQQIDGPRASSTFGSPNELAFALIVWSLMACGLLLSRPGRDRWLIPALVVILVGLALTFSRSAIGGAALGFLLIAVAAVRLSPLPRRALAVLALGVVPAFLLSGVIYAARGGGDMLSSTADTLLYGGSSGTKTVSIDIQSWVAGEPQAVTVTINNIHGSPERSYRGKIHFTSSDPNASLPADYAFNADDAGKHTFRVTDSTPLRIVSVGRQWIRVTDAQDNDITSVIFGTFVYPPSTHIKVEVGAWVAGTESPVTVTVLDARGTPWPGYRGTVHFTTSDRTAGVPGDYTFKASDGGTHTFKISDLPPLIFDTGGQQWVRVEDKVDPSLAGVASGTVTLPETIAVEVRSWALGAPQPVTVTIKDYRGRVDPTYRGTVHFESSDPNASLPADYTFTAADAGTHTFEPASGAPLQVVSVGTQWVRATDTKQSTITGQALGTFTYPPDLTFRVEVAAWNVNRSSAVTVTAVDGNGRPWTAYRGTVHFTSSDPRGTVPGDYTFQPSDAGSHTFAASQLPALTFRSLGDQWVRATDKIESSLATTAEGTVVEFSASPSPAASSSSSPSSAPESPTPSPTAAAGTPGAAATPPSGGAASTPAAEPSPSAAPSPTPYPTGPVVVPGYVPAADSSTAAHITSLTYGWDLLVHHPLGTGLGTVGPRPLPGTTDRPAYIIESYYLAMGVSLGWLGLAWAIALPLTMLLLAFAALRRKRVLEGSTLLAITISAAVVGVVLPTMMEPQIAMIPWSVCALTATALSRTDSPGVPNAKPAAAEGEPAAG